MALLTAAEAREFLPAITGVGEDTILTTRIAAVDSAIASYLGYPRASATVDATVGSTTYTLYSGGSDAIAVDGTKLILPVRPITSITSITDDPDLLTYGSGYLVDSGDYVIDALDGTVRLLPTASHGAWSRSPYAIKVVVVAGWATPPGDMKEAARICVQHLYGIRSRGTATSVTNHETTVNPQNVAIPEEAMGLLRPYRFAHGWVG